MTTATVLHRLALGVECLDGVTGILVPTPLRAGWQAFPRLRPLPRDPAWPCLDLEPMGTGRFRLRYQLPLPTKPLVIRIDDPTRRYVPRRFGVPVRLESTVDAPYVPVLSRVLRLWLAPGSAHRFVGGSTVLRGRIVRADGSAVRWARVTAIAPTAAVAGRAFTDDRGEFVLPVLDPDQNPLESTVDLLLHVAAAEPAPAPDPADRCADVPVEAIPLSSVPALPADLDNPVLRGASPPPGYVDSTLPAPRVSAVIGSEVQLLDDVVFSA
ncbi:MAG: carboxypeptidase-like regulatory domain-containing protein [Jatrophihabitantaceae bacterium]